jgi:hypothetical protein
MPDSSSVPDIPLVTTAEAVAEVRRWLEVEHVDPERIFAAAGEHVIRYKDLIDHLERGTPDGEMLRLAISRGRMIRQERAEAVKTLLTIAETRAGPRESAERRAPGAEIPESGEEPEGEEPGT